MLDELLSHIRKSFEEFNKDILCTEAIQEMMVKNPVFRKCPKCGNIPEINVYLAEEFPYEGPYMFGATVDCKICGCLVDNMIDFNNPVFCYIDTVNAWNRNKKVKYPDNSEFFDRYPKGNYE
jgi:hypothetical protein